METKTSQEKKIVVIQDQQLIPSTLKTFKENVGEKNSVDAKTVTKADFDSDISDLSFDQGSKFDISFENLPDVSFGMGFVD